MKNHQRDYYRKMRAKHISRKKRIVKETWGSSAYLVNDTKFCGKLSKNKIHCSCPDCSTKTKRDGYKISDIRKLNKLGYLQRNHTFYNSFEISNEE